MIELLSCGAFSYTKDSSRENQDAILLPQQMDNGYSFAVADGVGSYAGAKEAALTAIKLLSKLSFLDVLNPDSMLHSIKKTISDFAEENPEAIKAATTLTYCYLEQEFLHVIHVGDTRAYVKKDYKLKQLTKDHTQHQELLDEGLYTKKELDNLPGKSTLTSAISKVLPIRYQHLKIPTPDLADKDGVITIFLMSDGSHHFWEKRPRFSPNTLDNVTNFSSNLFKRIRRAGAIDDHSLVAASFKINLVNS